MLDEPTAGLDPAARIRLWEHFREINRRGTTVFLTTQHLEEADALCSNLAVILDGTIVATGSPAELKSQAGGDVLELGFEDSTGTLLDRARAATEASGVMSSDEAKTIRHTEDGFSVKSSRARQLGIEIIEHLTKAGFDVTGFDIRSPTLDDVFLALTDATITDVTRGKRPVFTQNGGTDSDITPRE